MPIQTGKMRDFARRFGMVIFIVGLAGCAGVQSTLSPAGRGAEDIARLFWWMTGGATVIWLAVAGLTIYAIHVKPHPHPRHWERFIIAGGVVVPVAVLGILLAFGLAMLPELVAPAPEGSQHINVTGEQWWWRIRYETPEGEFVELANEIHLPVGEPIDFSLEAADVIHAFWIPSLGGKEDMIPGRTNWLRLDPTKTGLYRGACAEYCGGAHAQMAFYVVVEEREQFEQWLAHQAAPAEPPSDSLRRRGLEVFLSSGCGACHTVRGTEADGVVGPDLTHVGGRQSLAAGILPNESEAFREWISHPKSLKPQVRMPRFDMLPDEDLEALAAYLNGLD